MCARDVPVPPLGSLGTSVNVLAVSWHSHGAVWASPFAHLLCLSATYGVLSTPVCIAALFKCSKAVALAIILAVVE